MDNTARSGSAMFDVKKLGTANFENSTTLGNSTMLKSDQVDKLNVKNSTAYGDGALPPPVAHSFDVANWFEFLETHEDFVAEGKDNSAMERNLRQTLEAQWRSLSPAKRNANRRELEKVLTDLKGTTFSSHYRDWPPSFVERPCN